MRRLFAAALAAAALTAGCATDTPPAAAPAPPASSSPSLAEQQQAPEAAVIPGYSVSLPKLGVRSSLVELGLNEDRTVQVPALDQPQQVGHYRGSPLPGAVGPSVLLAHVSGRIDRRAIPGAFAKLDTLVEGDHIDTTIPDGLATRTVRYVVYHVQSVAKDAFPTASVYGRTEEPELRLITCGGEFDSENRNFRSNIIAWARMVD